MSLVTVDNIDFTIDDVKIIDNVSLVVNKGQFINIIGPNGAGKSSLLKIIIGLIIPTCGSIKVNSHTKIGYMPQTLDVNSMMPMLVSNFLQTVCELTSEQSQNQINTLGIQHLLVKSIHSLSGGEMQRVLFARALLANPNLLILDEPEQGLDVDGRSQFYQLLEQIKVNNNIAVLMVSHDLNFVHKSSNFVICLNKHICCSGMPNNVLNSKEYKNLFDSSKTQTMKQYIHHHDHIHDDFK